MGRSVVVNDSEMTINPTGKILHPILGWRMKLPKMMIIIL